MTRQDRRRRPLAMTLAALAAAGALSACGGGDTARQTAARPGFNSADVGFAQQMIPHHLQAVRMASLAATRAKDPKVKKLAAAIAAARKPEIKTMEAWLATWGQPLMPGMSGMDYSQMSPEDFAALTPGAMPGMATAGELGQLRAAKGSRFDRKFLALLVQLHKGALKVAADEQADGTDPAATALAADIATTQSAELTRITKLLGSA